MSRAGHWNEYDLADFSRRYTRGEQLFSLAQRFGRTEEALRLKASRSKLKRPDWFKSAVSVSNSRRAA